MSIHTGGTGELTFDDDAAAALEADLALGLDPTSDEWDGPAPQGLAPVPALDGVAAAGLAGEDAPAAAEAEPQHRVRRAVWRSALAIVVLTLAVVGHSVYGALRAPGTDSLAARLAGWTRDHGGTPVVNFFERLTYKPPKVGGLPTGGIPTGVVEPAGAAANPLGPPLPPPAGPRVPRMGPHRPGTEPAPPPVGFAPAGPAHLAAPPAIAPVADPPIPDEGAWQVLQSVKGVPALRATFLRADPTYTSYVAAVAWMDTKLLRLELHPGTGEPGGGPWPHGSSIPPTERDDVVAAFNSGFRMADSRGGFYAGGRTAGSLREGAASLVISEDGSATIGEWGRDANLGPTVAAVRQNLDLIVDGGQVSPRINDNSGNRWGATLGNDLYVARSGIGVTEDGALLFAVGPRLSAATLAQLLVRAGAVRAMELDINPTWTIFVHYSLTPEGSTGTKLLATMNRPPTVYDTTSSRDFIVARSR